MCSTKQIPPLSIFSTRLKLIACLSSILQPCGRDMFLRNKLWFCCSFRPNDSAETKWIQIPKHFHHRYTQFYKLHDFPVLCGRMWSPGGTDGSAQGFQMCHASSFDFFVFSSQASLEVKEMVLTLLQGCRVPEVFSLSNSGHCPCWDGVENTQILTDPFRFTGCPTSDWCWHSVFVSQRISTVTTFTLFQRFMFKLPLCLPTPWSYRVN